MNNKQTPVNNIEKEKAIFEFRKLVAERVYKIYKLMDEINDLDDSFSYKYTSYNEEFFNEYLPVDESYPFEIDWNDQKNKILNWYANILESNINKNIDK